MLHYVVHELLALGEVAGIALPGLGLDAQGGQFGLECCSFICTAVTDISEGDVGAMFCKLDGDGFSDTPGRTGDDDDLVLQ
jgi:hypothetical protein